MGVNSLDIHFGSSRSSHTGVPRGRVGTIPPCSDNSSKNPPLRSGLRLIKRAVRGVDVNILSFLNCFP